MWEGAHHSDEVTVTSCWQHVAVFPLWLIAGGGQGGWFQLILELYGSWDWARNSWNEKVVMFWEKKSDPWRRMGDQLCWSCSNHWMCCEEQVELKVIQYTQVLSSRYTFGDFHYIFCLNFLPIFTLNWLWSWYRWCSGKTWTQYGQYFFRLRETTRQTGKVLIS